jgi:predicted nucleic acid-binding protein
MNVTTPVVVDTDVISFMFKNHSLGSAYQVLLTGKALTASLITLAEIEYGMEAKNWGSARRDLMRRFLSRFTLLPPDSETAILWARIKNNCDKKGRPITFADAWIAAAAVQLNIPLATHNARDYAAVDALTILTALPGKSV